MHIGTRSARIGTCCTTADGVLEVFTTDRSLDLPNEESGIADEGWLGV